MDRVNSKEKIKQKRFISFLGWRCYRPCSKERAVRVDETWSEK